MQVRRKGVVKRIIRVCPVLNLAVPTRYIEQAVMVILNAETGVLAGVGPAPLLSAIRGHVIKNECDARFPTRFTQGVSRFIHPYRGPGSLRYSKTGLEDAADQARPRHVVVATATGHMN